MLNVSPGACPFSWPSCSLVSSAAPKKKSRRVREPVKKSFWVLGCFGARALMSKSCLVLRCFGAGGRDVSPGAGRSQFSSPGTACHFAPTLSARTGQGFEREDGVHGRGHHPDAAGTWPDQGMHPCIVHSHGCRRFQLETVCLLGSSFRSDMVWLLCSPFSTGTVCIVRFFRSETMWPWFARRFYLRGSPMHPFLTSFVLWSCHARSHSSGRAAGLCVSTPS